MRDEPGFGAAWELSGELLSRAPRGFQADHPLIEDLRRKDLVGFHRLRPDDALASDFVSQTARRFEAAAPFMAWLCGALGLEY